MSLFPPRRDPSGLHAGNDLQANAPAVRIDGVKAGALAVGHARLVAVAVAFSLTFGAIAVRMVDIAEFSHGLGPVFYHSVANPTDVSRADIVDRNGVVLATSLPTVTLYARPKEIRNPVAATDKLLSVLPDLNRAKVLSDLSSHRYFVYLHRDLTPHQQYLVNALGIPGFHFQKDERRVYPQGDLVAHLIGLTNIDNRGISGVEREFDKRLRSSHKPLRLSIDIRMQQVVHDAVKNAVTRFSAAGGCGIVMNVDTGEVLAMVSLPDFDPNNPPAPNDPAMFDRATDGVYEMGSTFKLFDAAAAFKYGAATMQSKFDATHPLDVNGAIIHDFDAQNRVLTVPEILIYSSNIGAARMALKMGADDQRTFLKSVGMLAPLHFQVPELGTPLYPRNWRPINTATIAFGHGISVTPLHLITGVSALIDGGIYHNPTLLPVAPGTDVPGHRVISRQNSRDIRDLMRQVVLKGTGKYATVPGYDVGGKTGTAEEVVDGRYKNGDVRSSFMAAFPMSDPRYAVLVLIDKPHGIKATYGLNEGAWVAAPAVARIISRIGPMVGFVPRKPQGTARGPRPTSHGRRGIADTHRDSRPVKRNESGATRRGIALMAAPPADSSRGGRHVTID